MKSLNTYISEGGFFKNVKAEMITPKGKQELIKIIKDTISKEGPNCNLNFINVSNITDMSGVFSNSKFNGDISEWNVSNVKNMVYMFANSSFNGDISKWDIRNVKNMAGMFYNSTFNGDISGWDVSKVENMGSMFYNSKLEKLKKVPEWYK